MIDDVETGWLYASANGPQPVFADLTFEIPNRSVVATTAVSAFSAGVRDFVPGSVATYVREYGVFTGPSAIDIISVPPDPANNTLYIEHCAFVRFRLTVFQATAWAQACVFLYPAPTPPTPKPPKKASPKTRFKLVEFGIRDGTGGRIGAHRVFSLRRQSVLRVDELLTRSTREVAEHFDIPRKRMRVARQRVGRPPRAEVRYVF